MTEPAVDGAALTKRYGDVVVVDEVPLRIEPGEIYALLGLNGAGKTTTIRLLLGMIRPTSGTVSVLGTPDPPVPSLAAHGRLWLRRCAVHRDLDSREHVGQRQRPA